MKDAKNKNINNNNLALQFSTRLKVEGDEQTNHYSTKVIQHQKGHQHTKDI
jgi:hypothetical protein